MRRYIQCSIKEDIELFSFSQYLTKPQLFDKVTPGLLNFMTKITPYDSNILFTRKNCISNRGYSRNITSIVFTGVFLVTTDYLIWYHLFTNFWLLHPPWSRWPPFWCHFNSRLIPPRDIQFPTPTTETFTIDSTCTYARDVPYYFYTACSSSFTLIPLSLPLVITSPWIITILTSLFQ